MLWQINEVLLTVVLYQNWEVGNKVTTTCHFPNLSRKTNCGLHIMTEKLVLHLLRVGKLVPHLLQGRVPEVVRNSDRYDNEYG